MAKVLKRCDCPREAWARCPHSWTVRWWADGRQHERSFRRNWQQAKAHAKTVEAAKGSIHRGEAPTPVTFGAYVEGWLPHLKRNTRIAYGSALANHVLPVCGQRQLADVAADRDFVQSLLRSMRPGTARVALVAIRSLVSEAKLSGHVQVDRLSRLKVDPLEPTQFLFPTVEQMAALADGLAELAPAVWIMRGCGLRPGEVLAVRSTDFDGPRLRVARQLMSDGTLAPLKARKPGEFRDVPVPDYVSRTVDCLDAGSFFSTSRPTFSARFRVSADVAGLKGFRPHDLRHVFASVALAGGVPLPDVARWLGHRDIQTTYRTYSHFLPDSWSAGQSVLDAEYTRWVSR